MWCRHCQQDVPAIARPGGGTVVCARCQRRLNTANSTHTVGISDCGVPLEKPVEPESWDPVSQLRDWQTDHHFRTLARTIRYGPTARGPEIASGHATPWRLDPPHDLTVESEPPAASAVVPQARHIGRGKHRRSEAQQWLSWLTVLLGMFALSGGIGLGCWSLLAGRLEYWYWALALALVGQGMLILGLVMVVTRLWRQSRMASGKLQEIHWQLNQVQRTTETIVGLRNDSAPAFFAELARGASPQILLANLRGQLDQLASRIIHDG